MNLEIVSPEAILFSGNVDSVAVPGMGGAFQVLNHHANIVSILEAGDVKFETAEFIPDKTFTAKFKKIEDRKYVLSISSGTVEMKDNNITILVD